MTSRVERDPSPIQKQSCPMSQVPASQVPTSQTVEKSDTDKSNNTVSPLSSHRAVSSIPSKHGPWLYPSEKQFYKTTVQKGANVSPEDMSVVVAIHNSINEKAWEKIMQYEKLHVKNCSDPKLIRFSGISEVRTPKARLRSLLGYVEPFDTHEWLVDRCGKTVRYLIDYYEGNSRPLTGKPIAVYIDARPELSFSSIVDRIRMYCRLA